MNKFVHFNVIYVGNYTLRLLANIKPSRKHEQVIITPASLKQYQ